MRNPDEQSVGAGALVLLPTYNERATLPTTVAGILHHAPAAHILIIDDASPDGTGALADKLAADPRVSVHHRPGKHGLGTAYAWGFQTAAERGYPYVVEMDSDGSHLAEELPTLLAAAAQNGGLVIGARWVPGGRIVNWPWYRRWISRTGTAVARLALRSQLRDLTSGYRVLATAQLPHLELSQIDSQGYAFQVETAWALERHGVPIAEVPITFVERAEGHSKMTVGIVWEALRGVLRWGWRLRVPGRAATNAPHTREAP